MADHQGMTKAEYLEEYGPIYQRNWFSDQELPLARNYVVFSASPEDCGYISPNPPEVARAVRKMHEVWVEESVTNRLKALTLGKGPRGYLRSANTNLNPHRQIRFEMTIEEAKNLRDELIRTLKEASNDGKNREAK